MNNNINTQATTFWNFLKENTIEIPIIQRDYAQGRLGKENLRKNFLADLKNALDSGRKMKLDFVYGSIENDNLNPLDGQQRLTSLWLLHWYIALRAGELSEDNCKIFRKFTYETRISSREFCQNLCNPKHFDNFERNDIVGFITKQTWFYSAWKQDPTIQSMLRMLGGTKIADKKGEDIIDGIEELFQETNEDGFKSYWEKLTKKEVIVFYHLPLKDFGLSDDLYIKMNARGKQLTSFENFKADLIGYITKQAEDNPESEWTDLLDAKNGIPIKLDTDWTDIFWKNKSKESNIDEIYFAFINRYFLQELICAKKEDNTDLYSVDYLEKENVAFRHLYGEKGDDSRLQYSGLDKYPFSDDKVISHFLFTSFSDTLKNFKQDYSICKFFGACCLNAYFPTWVDSKFEFIPRYDETGNITTLGQKERVVFLAVCRYFEKGNFNNVLFKRWMRVVWNIVENSGIETISAMIGAMRLIDELSEGAHDIYNFLSNSQLQVKSQFAKDQVVEEIAKAKQILYGAPRSDGKSWEEIIIKAEKFVFFKGAIRFLFTDGDRNINWCDFDTKWANAQTYFDKNGVKDCEETKYKTEAILLKAVLYHVKDFGKYIEPQKFVLDNAASTWKKNILLEQGWENAVHEVLMGELDVPERNEDCLMYRNLYKTDLLNYVANEQVGSRIRWHHGHRTVYPPRYDGIMLDDENRDKPFYRNSILSSLPNITSSQRIKDKPFYKGWDINFNYTKNGHSYDFQWNTDEHVYLIENNERKKKADGTDYCVSVEGIKDSKDFQQNLDNLINQVSQNEQ